MTTLEIYWSFRSPYSYMATGRLCEIAKAYPIEINFRLVRPLALREPDFFTKGRPQFLSYLLKDVLRESARKNIQFAMPQPDPVIMDMASGVVDKGQPLMDLLMSLGVAANALGAGLEFAHEMSRKIWTGVPDWNAREILSEVSETAGIPLVQLEAWLVDNGGEVETIIAQNEKAQMEHHWGVPLMVLDGEPFFGQDRIASLIWRLDEKFPPT